MVEPAEVAELFALMQAVRSRSDGISPQRLADPEPIERIERGIPTLKSDVLRSPTPLLVARFTFAGSWEESLPGLTLFGLDEMQKGARRHLDAMKEVKRHPELAKFHGVSPPGRYPPEDLAEFGFSEIWSTCFGIGLLCENRVLFGTNDNIGRNLLTSRSSFAIWPAANPCELGAFDWHRILGGVNYRHGHDQPKRG